MKKQRTVAQRKALYGWLFILPFTIGFVMFFIQPLVFSIIYSFNTLRLTPDGMDVIFKGFDNYIQLFTKDVEFLPYFAAQLRQMAVQVPFILLFSLFIAIILNQKFRGRAAMRAVFFLPVIISSGVIISLMKQDVFSQSITAGSAQASYIFQSSGIAEMLANSNIPTAISNYVTEVINGCFDMLWKTGVQTLVFLAAVQSIPGHLYEAAKVEGATAWESFWKITFPMISPMILVNVVYSIIDTFTDYNNAMMQMIIRIGFNEFRYGYACAMAWVYMAAVLAILGVIVLIVRKMIFYYTET